jgi:hypothetical protein
MRELTKALEMACSLYWCAQTPGQDRAAALLIEELKRIDPLLDQDFAQTVAADG